MNNTKCYGIAFYIGEAKLNSDSIWIDHAICAITKSSYSHVELILYKTQEGLYECFSASHRDRGVRFKTLDLDSGNWKILKTENSPNFSEVFNFYKKYGEARYDYLGLLSTVLPFTRINFPNRMFCSELVATLYSIRLPCTYSPQTLYNYIEKENKHG